MNVRSAQRALTVSWVTSAQTVAAGSFPGPSGRRRTGRVTTSSVRTRRAPRSSTGPLIPQLMPSSQPQSRIFRRRDGSAQPCTRRLTLYRGEQMKIRISAFSARVLALGALLAVSPLSFAAETSGSKTTAKDVSRKVDETGQAIKNYTLAQRDEAIKKAKSGLDDLDA